MTKDYSIQHTREGSTFTGQITPVIADILSSQGWSPTVQTNRWYLPDSAGLPANWFTIGETAHLLAGIGLDGFVSSNT